ncbi:YlxR family protein [Mycoplasmopsis alligatoris]|uniref:YlxR domain-containing protein n=1 Tax=Mycoplasmopsis alligatoris A21JP2 TaxID=747682 RepID=D4XWG1_9BACT|nr:YlxR family protein [Mycoplasmopsis alligatoris]EFF41261.1 conserved hypothetical protein [Mycoplasmopsis alligatoris A21JP2]
MNEKNSYTRKCVATNQIYPIDELIRFDYDKANNILSLDLKLTKKGRGCYLKNDPNLWTTFYNKKCLNRSFKTNFTSEQYEKIYKELMEAVWQKKQTE